MSIDKEGNVYVLRCDICGERALQDFDEPFDAAKYVKYGDWKAEKRDGEWGDVCPECQEE